MDATDTSFAPGLKTGTATRERGKIQVEKILKEGRSLLINEGYAGLTLRKVAKNLDISLGNLTYYFPNKDALLRALIADLLDEYHQELLAEQQRFPDDPHGRFLAYLEYLISDCQNADTRAFFFQIWGLATHSDLVKELRDEIYTVARADARELIAPLNPNASVKEVNTLVALFVSMIEGLHVLADMNRDKMRLPADFERQFRNRVYALMTEAHDARVQQQVEQHLPKKLRKY